MHCIHPTIPSKYSIKLIISPWHPEGLNAHQLQSQVKCLCCWHCLLHPPKVRRACLVSANASLTKTSHANILARDSAAAVSPASGRQICTGSQYFGMAVRIWLPTKQEPILVVNANFLVGQLRVAIQTAPKSPKLPRNGMSRCFDMAPPGLKFWYGTKISRENEKANKAWTAARINYRNSSHKQ